MLNPISTLLWTVSWAASVPVFLMRLYRLVWPAPATKSRQAIRLGLFGASKIAPMAVINPARSHPDVIVAAVAARDKARAAAYAKKYDIPNVHTSYDDLLADPSIDAVYIPLPNGLHYEWALKSLQAGKHVLLEKPSTSNGEEARLLFSSPLVKSPDAPILVEAFHYRFHPAFSVYKSLVGDPSKVERVSATALFPRGAMALDDIRYQYDLAGGTLMDLGTYTVSWLRHTFDAEPEECIAASYTALPGAYAVKEPRIDLGIRAAWRFPGGGVGEVDANLNSTGATPWLPAFIGRHLPTVLCPRLVAQLREERCAPADPGVRLAPDETHWVKKTVSFWNPLLPVVWHRIDVDEVHTVRDATSFATRTWTTHREVKAYVWPEADKAGAPWWGTYRYQLEEFVNAVKGRPGSGVWIAHENSVAQMDMIDSAYRKAGLPPRPTSEYRP